MRVQEPVADLIIGNITGAREADNPDPVRKLAAAAITRARARQEDNVKAQNMKEISSRFFVSREELCKLQSEDDELKAFFKSKDLTKRGKFEVKFEKRQGILHRIRRRIDGLGETWKQIMVPKSLRVRVMEVVHDSIFGGHLGVKKTKNRIKLTSTGLECIMTSVDFADPAMYVKRPLKSELLPELLSAKCR